MSKLKILCCSTLERNQIWKENVNWIKNFLNILHAYYAEEYMESGFQYDINVIGFESNYKTKPK